MKNSSAIVGRLLSGDDGSIREILRALVVDGNLGHIDDAIGSFVINRAAEKKGVSVSKQELQCTVETYRRALGLHRASDTHAWLDRNSLTIDDLSQRVGGAIVRTRLKRRLTEGRVEAYFDKNPHQFEFATISEIVVGEVGHAEELRKRLDARSTDFPRIARECSLDETTRRNGGFVGVVRRADLNLDAASGIFERSNGEIVGPIQTDIGHHLIRVEHIHSIELSEPIRATIENILFREWLQEEIEKTKKLGTSFSNTHTQLPRIEIADLAPAEDKIVAARKGIFQDSTALTTFLHVTDTEATLSLHRNQRSKPSASVPELLVKLYKPLFDPLRGFQCCGLPLDQCPHV